MDEETAYTFLTNCSLEVGSESTPRWQPPLQRKSQKPGRPPMCFKWITPVCHCDYTLLAAVAMRWIVFGGSAGRFLFLHAPPGPRQGPPPLAPLPLIHTRDGASQHVSLQPLLLDSVAVIESPLCSTLRLSDLFRGCFDSEWPIRSRVFLCGA